MTEEAGFVPEKLVETLQGFPNGTKIEDLDKIVQKCVEENSKLKGVINIYSISR